MQQIRRISWIDVAKGITIILVVIGHLNVKWFPRLNPLISEIYTFHMALFFILSGLTFKIKEDDSFKRFIIKKLKTLVIPYYVFSLLCFVKPLGNIVLQVINKSAFNINNLITTAYETFIMGEGLWFLLCLFWAELLLYLIIKILKNDKKKIIVVILVLSIIQSIYLRFINWGLPLKLDNAFLGLLFVGIGYVFKEMIFNKKISKINKYVYIIDLLVVHLIVNYITYRLYGRMCSFSDSPNYLLYFISNISGSLIIIEISKIIMNNKILEFYGKNSLIVYIFNDLILKIYKSIILIILRIDTANLNLIMQYLISLVICICTILTIIPVIIFINKYFYFLLGKKKESSK